MNNNQNKQLLFGIIGIAILVIAVVGVTYAFFSYTRTGNTNTVQAGRIVFNSTQGDAINLSNAFPITNTQALTDTTNAKTLQITVTGDTSYGGGIEYLVTATDVHMTTTTGKTVPLTIEVSVTGNNSKTLGTSNDDYYTNRGGNTSMYKVEYDGSLDENDHILVGYIAPDNNQTGVDGIINIKTYFNDADILITDTPDTVDTTGKTVLSTTEWNSLKGNNALSFKIKVEAREGTWVEEVLSVNAMGTFYVNAKNIYDQGGNIKEVHFNRMSSSAMQTSYDNAEIKADLTYNNEGKVLAWLEENQESRNKYNLIVASDGETYLTTGSGLFANLGMEEIEFNNINTSRVTNMSAMFTGCSNLQSLNLNNFDFSSVTIIQPQSFVSGCSSLKYLYMRNANFNNLTTDMFAFLNGASSLETVDISNMKIENVTTMNAFFSGSENSLKTVNMSNLYAPNLTDVTSLFAFHSKLTNVNLENINANNIVNFTAMFQSCSSLEEIDLSSITPKNDANTTSMFSSSSQLKKIYVSSSWKNNITQSDYMFNNCTSLVGQAPNTTYGFDSSEAIDKTYAVIATDTTKGYLTDISLKP